MRGKARRCLAALAAAAVLLALGGCGGTQQQGLSFRVCLAAASESYDTIYAAQDGDRSILFHLYENLMRLERDGEGQMQAVPAAARSVTVTDHPDGTAVYTFRLREARWSDGREVRAQDFVYAWRRLADPASASEYASLLSCVRGYDQARATGDMSLLAVEAKNNTTLAVTLTGHYTAFLSQVCTAVATMPLRQDVVYRLKQAAQSLAEGLPEGQEGPKWCQDPTALVTNGPYSVREQDPGVSVTLAASERYEGPAASGPGAIVFRFAAPEAAQTLYETGEADLLWPLSEQALQQLRTQGAAWQEEAKLSTYCVLFNCAQLLDVSLRQALSLSLDRSAIAGLAGSGALAAEGLVPPGVPGGEERFRQEGGALLQNDPEGYAQRCAQAAALLRQAGYDLSGDVGQLEYLYIEGEENAAVARAVCRMWRTVLGMEITPRGMTPSALTQALQAGSYTLAGLEVEALSDDAASFLLPWVSQSPDNLLHYESSAYDTLMAIIAGAKDASARMGCLHDAEDLLLELDCAIAPLYTASTAWSLREDYTGALRDARGWFDLTGVMPRPQSAG